MLLLIGISFGCAASARPIEIATTTSVVNSGLLDYALSAFPGAQPRVHAAGSGRALVMLADGTVALAITHAPDAEAKALASHPDWSYRKFAYNHFVIVGPDSDPAEVRSAATATEAFRRIATRRVAFVSRGDESGTHEREIALWRSASVDPAKALILVSGGSMATTLRQADQQLAYTLSDDGTWWQLKDGLKLAVLFEHGPELLNTYAVIHDKDALAERLAAWLVSQAGRDRIASYRIADHPAFTIWPSSCPDSTPAALPGCGNDGNDRGVLR